MNRPLPLIAGLLGVLFLAIAALYWFVPAGRPSTSVFPTRVQRRLRSHRREARDRFAYHSARPVRLRLAPKQAQSARRSDLASREAPVGERGLRSASERLVIGRLKRARQAVDQVFLIRHGRLNLSAWTPQSDRTAQPRQTVWLIVNHSIAEWAAAIITKLPQVPARCGLPRTASGVRSCFGGLRAWLEGRHFAPVGPRWTSTIPERLWTGRVAAISRARPRDVGGKVADLPRASRLPRASIVHVPHREYS